MEWQIVIDVLWGIVLTVYYGFLSLAKALFPDKFKKSIKGDIVLITGGGSGIGRLMAYKLSNLGAVIVTVDINKKGNEETVRKITNNGGEAHSYICDLSNREEIYEVSKKIQEDIGNITILINNAGIVSGNDILSTKDDKIELTFKVNTLAHFWTIKSFLPGMIAQKKGHIVNVASLAGFSGSPKLVDYCSSKFAAVGLDEALRLELKHQKLDPYVKTTVVCPFYINTGMFSGVESKLIPILEPQYVAERAVEGILIDQEIVLIPWWTKFLFVLKALLPSEGYASLAKAMGLNSAMDEFIGRRKAQ